MRILHPLPTLRRGFFTVPQLRNTVLIIFSILLVAVVGCGETRGKVSGTVKYKDKIVKGGTVVFVRDGDFKQTRVEIKEDGTYTSAEVFVGNNKVGVEPASKGAMNMAAKKGGKMPNIPGEGPKDVYSKGGGEFVDIPQVLRDPATSKLSTEVQRGEQTFNINLTDPK